MKRLISLFSAILFLGVATLSSSAFTLQSSHTYKSADDSGAYVISYSGSHVDISRYSTDPCSAGLNLSYAVSSVCAYRGRIVAFCDDSNNNQLIVYVYYLDSDILDSFALYDVKLYNDTDFCCDENAIYIENHRNSRELIAYSYNGNVSDRYRFNQQITSLCNDYHSGIYAVSDDTLYRMSGNGFTAVNGERVDYPLFPAASDILVSDYGHAYVMNGNRISRVFTVDSRFGTAFACVIGNRLYYPCGSVIYGYDIADGSKASSYQLAYDTSLLYAVGDSMIAVGNGSYTSVSPRDFTELNVPDDRSDNSGNSNNNNNNNNTVFEGELAEISSGVYSVDHSRYTISGIPPETTIAQFKSNMRYSGWSVALYRDDTMKTSGNVGTAMTAVFTASGSSVTFELSVIGDLTGEGNCNSRDIHTLLDYLIGTADFNGVYSISADLSDDGIVDAVDAAKLKKMTG